MQHLLLICMTFVHIPYIRICRKVYIMMGYNATLAVHLVAGILLLNG